MSESTELSTSSRVSAHASPARGILPRYGSDTVICTPSDTSPVQDVDGDPGADAIAERAESLERSLALADMCASLDPGTEVACGLAPAEGCTGVTLSVGPEGVRFVDRRKCESPSTCSNGAKKRLWTQRPRLQDLILSNTTAGGSAILVTLTLAFPTELSLEDRWRIIRDMYKKLTSSTRRHREAAGVLRRARIVHLVHGEGGWHVHLHCIYFLKQRITHSAAHGLQTVEAKKWSQLATEFGCSADEKVQAYTIIGDSEADARRVAKYLTKGIEELQFGAPDEPAPFKCRFDRKNRSPWQLLHDATFNNDAAAGKAFAQWATVIRSAKFKQQSIPKTLNRPTATDGLTDTEVAA